MNHTTTITDDLLHPYFLVCRKGTIEVYKKKNRKKSDGTTEIYNSKIATKSGIREALKAMVTDALGKNKKKKPVNIKSYVNEYTKLYLELKKILSVDELPI